MASSYRSLKVLIFSSSLDITIAAEAEAAQKAFEAEQEAKRKEKEAMEEMMKQVQ